MPFKRYEQSEKNIITAIRRLENCHKRILLSVLSGQRLRKSKDSADVFIPSSLFKNVCKKLLLALRTKNYIANYRISYVDVTQYTCRPIERVLRILPTSFPPDFLRPDFLC